MAEGIARAFMPPEVQVWSAGSSPTNVRPEAIAVLQEIGIDISHHRSKSIDEIPASEVDTVIALCAEEVCPVFLGHVLRLHTALPDSAAIGETAEERLAAFRKTRDELHRRISILIEDHNIGGLMHEIE
jgi:arsenate reductase